MSLMHVVAVNAVFAAVAVGAILTFALTAVRGEATEAPATAHSSSA